MIRPGPEDGPDEAEHYSARSTRLHSDGNCAIVKGGRGLPGFGCSISGVNQLASSAPHPSPGGGDAWFEQLASPAGQAILMWK
jgi:hypothetical protein